MHDSHQLHVSQWTHAVLERAREEGAEGWVVLQRVPHLLQVAVKGARPQLVDRGTEGHGQLQPGEPTPRARQHAQRQGVDQRSLLENELRAATKIICNRGEGFRLKQNDE